MPSRPTAPAGTASSGSVIHTSSCRPPGGSRRIWGAAVLVTYTEPSCPMAMSLQNVCSPGSSADSLPAPVLRSKPLSVALVSDPATDTPTSDRLFEHAQSVLDFSSTSTPNMDLVPNAPGFIQDSALYVCSLTR